MAHKPRLWIPDQVMHGVIRTVDRAFLLIPTASLTAIIGACVGRALQMFPVQLHACMANINHIHFLVSVSEAILGNGAPFFQYLNGQLAREVNKYWERTGHVWANRIRLEPCVDDKAAERMLAYVMANPIKDDLVALTTDWTGFSTYQQLATGDAVEYSYIDRGAWWKQGGPLGAKSQEDFRKSVEVQTTPLPHWKNLSTKQRSQRFLDLVTQAEEQQAERRKLEGKKVIGLPAILRENPRNRPQSKPEQTPQPLCHASSKKAVKKFKEIWKNFLDAYREASASYRGGFFDVAFPPGSFRPPLVTVYTAGT